MSQKLELSLVIHPNDGLREKASGFKHADVIDMDSEVRQIAGAMIRAMYKYAGIGLAAQQVGVKNAIFVLDAQWPVTGRHKPKIFLNPVIKEYAGGAVALSPPGEGCLSTPYGFKSQVQRSEAVRIEWRDLNWELHNEWFDGVEAIAIQHEIDHLHGYLFVDRLSGLKRDIFNRKVKKTRRHYMQGVKAVKKKVKKRRKK
jgi:peptide deformylase